MPGGSSFAHQDIEEQILAINRLLEDRPGDATLFLRRGELHRIHRDWKKAEADYLKAGKLDPEIETIDFCMGRLKLESGKPEQARGFLDRYLAARPNDAKAYALRGRALARLGEHLAAAEDFSRAISQPSEASHQPELYLERASAMIAAGPEHLSAALRGLDEGLDKLGEPVTLQLRALELEIQGRRYDAALRRLDRLASQATRQEPWLIRKGGVLEAAGRTTEALAVYKQALVAIETLPESRRTNKAALRLESEAREALKRLDREDANP